MEGASLSTYVEVGQSPDRSLLGVRIGQYEIIRLLGRGGMGEVFLARDLRLGRLVAVKLLMGQQPDLARECGRASGQVAGWAGVGSVDRR